MLWVMVFVGIAVAGLMLVASYAVWLAHKTADVWSEVAVLTDRGGQLLELLAQVGAPSEPPSRDRHEQVNPAVTPAR